MGIEEIFKALACRWRVEILKEIAQKDLCMCELEAMKHLDPSTLSRHISVLKKAGLVDVIREGKRKRLILKDPRILELIELAERIAEGRE
ncbi:ArsR family transcriptional regulator [Thermotoga maritima MSB8]|uniref:Transcriptional regulator, metal-sensing n=1 Tax=Thermotoga maritima (strain ATCC 43589 / DSM 3109 / JCM 10099 / NBRC 100826 / MSB8) TaxID=243274 RepID=Q9X0Q8_THEMA|nr:metalloregulator ArsR/SmtB family transcription factor [Thermotoga maritima]AAD36251.1 transcriptional regulator, metal-sensing [Thermotoga maritima MSB8]AGL50107.1 transcriptional regulator, metal-sensing [Thermotoga maritima MSB8]AHD18917.1 ArsR family transcriptional regulator [Thermotoga maritima MSB8]AKE27088.1 ArsR family transcriptional regulator [Thermotoga maritima]AKE28953.1 ArsR family transcriptional regulator [Thermotoga maritima MSB8]